MCVRVRERERKREYTIELSIYENALHLMLVCVDNIFV